MAERSRVAIAAGIVGLVATSVYVAVLIAQDSEYEPSMLYFATAMALASAFALIAGRLRRPRSRALLAAASAVIFLAIGWLAILSIGGLFVIAGVLASVAAVRATRAQRSAEHRRAC